MKKAIVLIAVVVAVAFAPASATIINIPGDYPTIQQGIDASSDGDTVLVQPGTYVENINFNGRNIVLGSLFLTTGDTSYILQTVIDGDSSGTVVTFESSEDSAAIIMGFTIQSGYTDGSGGGIKCISYSSPSISNNIITDNSADYGGGIVCYNSDPIIDDNTVSRNLATIGCGICCDSYSSPTISDNILSGNSGNISAYGGICCRNHSSPTIINNTIDGNSTCGISSHDSGPIVIENTINGNSGRGIYCYYSNLIIYNNIISGNSDGGICCYGRSPAINENVISENLAGDGAGIFCFNCNSTISNNTISGNSADWSGGGIYCDNSRLRISCNDISGNTADRGGGIFSYWYSIPTIINNTIRGNSAQSYGAGINCNFRSDPAVINNVITENSAVSRGGGIYCNNSNPTIVNSILWADNAPNGPEICIDNGAPIFMYCDIEGGWEGVGNIDIDPLFRDPQNNDFHLMAIQCNDPYDSPCIDAGHPHVLDSLLDCSWGLCTVLSDMGAYSGGGFSSRVINIPDDYPTIQAGINASSDGDTVLVSPGTYMENIDFYGRNIVVGSLFLITGDTSYISSTAIDGDSSGSVVTFRNEEDSTTVIIGFTLRNGSEGGIRCTYSNPIITNNIINRNSGGGIRISYSSPTVINNVITENSGNWSGGGISGGHNSSPVISNNIICDNSAANEGGGISCFWRFNAMITNNIITGNSADLGGGIHCYFSIPYILNNTISNNSAQVSGGIYCKENSNPIIKNTIFWANSAPHYPEIYYDFTSVSVITYCDVQGSWEGAGNIDVDPLFRDPENNDFHLMAIQCNDPYDSPCIDTGHPDILDSLLDCGWGLGELRSDMGAYGGGDSIPHIRRIINIPYDYLTIQAGINASSDGDTVLVEPGIYVENINFVGFNIVVGSLFLTTGDTSYISSTIIDGDSSGSVVTFETEENSTAVIIGFTIRHGYARYGGGIYCVDHSDPTIKNNVIRCNSVEWTGAGIYCSLSSPIISENAIRENVAPYDAGGISCDYLSSPTVVKNTIIGNSAMQGGGIHCRNRSGPNIINNIIIQNSASGYGGGISCTDHSDGVIIGNAITANSADTAGGGIFCRRSAYPVLSNTIFWDNNAPNGSEIYTDGTSSPIVTYCDIHGGWEGEGNIDIDPLFRDPENIDFHLMAIECGDPYDSPCIDAGDPDILDSLLDCEWGLGEFRSDMGAYSGGDSVQVGIDEKKPEVPDQFTLEQNYPNPFNATTIIRYNLPTTSNVIITIYDILGRKVTTLVNSEQPAGYHQVVWNPGNVSSGIYFYKIQAVEFIETKKMLLLK